MADKKRAPLFVLLLALLLPLRAAQESKPRDYTAWLIGHAHIDLSWLWLWEETVHDIAVQTFSGTLTQMNKMPGLTFAQSQAAVYEAIEKSYPELFDQIRQKVREGTWVPVGGMWAEPDLNMPDGEALARQLLYGKNYFRQKFGVDVTVGWNPDSFGHNAQLPQLLRQAGIKYYVFERCAPPNKPFFWWQGLDGSRVLAYVPPGWYLVSLREGVKELLREAGKDTFQKDFLLLYGAGDHGGGPRDSDLEAIARFRNDPEQPRLEFATPESFFHCVEKEGERYPVVSGELNFAFPACYTTQTQTKKNNRQAENLLLTAEKFSALAVFGGWRDYYPERDLDEAWKIVLRNQFHDILDGSSIGPVYGESGSSYREAFNRGERARDFSLAAIANAIDTRGNGLPLVVFNPLAWTRSDTVSAEMALPGEATAVRVLDQQGRPVLAQVMERQLRQASTRFRFVFLAEDVPACGYSLYRVLPASRPDRAPSDLRVSRTLLENEYFRIRLDPHTGWLASLWDKRNQREVLRGPGNVLQAIVDEPESMSAWELGLKGEAEQIGVTGARLKLVEAGPVRAVLRVEQPFRHSLFRQEIILGRRLPRVDVRLWMDWQERNLMIKCAFPAALQNPAAVFEIPFGAIGRPANGREVVALRWADLSEPGGGYGLSLLNDCKYGYDAQGSVLRLSLVHGATQPDPEADRGEQSLLYSLYPHAGDWQAAGTLRRGYELNNPLIPWPALVHSGVLPAAHSFISVLPENVVLSSIKKESGYYNRGLVLRLYEAFGRRTQVRLTVPWPVEVWECDLLEKPLAQRAWQEGQIALEMNPFEIKTLKLLPQPAR